MVALLRRQRSHLVPLDPSYWYYSRLMRFVVSVSSTLLRLLFHQSMFRSRKLTLRGLKCFFRILHGPIMEQQNRLEIYWLVFLPQLRATAEFKLQIRSMFIIYHRQELIYRTP